MNPMFDHEKRSKSKIKSRSKSGRKRADWLNSETLW